MYRIILIVLFSCFSLAQVAAQEHKWAFDIQNSSGSARINCQTVDDSSNIFIGGVFQGTMFIGTDTFTFSSSTNFAIFIAKYDEDGNYIWGKAFTSATNANIADLVINSQGQILVFGKYTNAASSSITFGTTTLTSSTAVFVAFMNSSGSFTDARDLGYGSFTTALNIALGQNDEIIVAMYLNGFGSGWNVVNGSSGSGFVNVVAKFNKTASAVSWSNAYSIYDMPNFYDLSVDRFDQIYFSCRAAASVSIFGTTTASTGVTSFLVWLRPNGNLRSTITAISTGTLQNAIARVEALDSSSIYLAGYSYRDSIIIGNSPIYGLSSNPNNTFNWVANLSSFDTISWSRSTSSPSNTAAGRIELSVNGDFLYFSTLINTTTFSFGGFSSTAYTPAVLSKLDRLGNVLWYLPIGSGGAPRLSGIGNQDLFYSGGYTGTLSLSPFSLSNTSSTSRPFLARTYDYSITRGQVRSGPYCAGDTLLVPYQKVGEFDTSNFFIAEISDEAGNFLGGQRELGRLKTTKDSTVIGFLPLFQVASSANYRIRITSTKPVVQSYYKLDTLNLLIYSRDEADPGPDTTICFGDTIQLSTFGGTTWKWSPAYSMSDSLLRNPLIWPRMDTVYQIIIGDSSGCGLADTADIRVHIRDLPEFVASSQSDTLVCKNQKVWLKNSFTGGTNTYYIHWFDQTGTKLQSTTSTGNSDSLELTPSITGNYIAVLTDSCASLLDTVFYRVQVFDTMQISRLFQDSLICKGQSISFSAQVAHPRLDSVSYIWQQTGSSTILSTDSFYSGLFVNNSEVKLTVVNTCNSESKTLLYDVFTHPSISNAIGEISPRQFLCRGDSVLLLANPQGGQSIDSLQSSWKMNGLNWTSDTLVLYADSLSVLYPSTDTFTVLNIASDRCTTPADTVYYGFRLFPELSIDSLIGLEQRLCYLKNQPLNLIASGGLGTGSYSYSWFYNAMLLDTTANFNLSADSFTQGQSHSIQSVVKDGCSIPDTLTFQFYIPTKPEVSINGSDTAFCSGSSVFWSSAVQGGDTLNYRYEWRLNGQIISNSDTVSSYFENNKPSTDSIYWLSVSLADSCSSEISKDSLLIRVAPNPVVSFSHDSISRSQYSDTLICRGEELLITIHPFYTEFSAMPALYQNGNLVSSSGSFLLQNTELIAEDSVVFQAIIVSDCGINADTATHVVYLREALTLDPIEDSIVCANTNVSFLAIARGGLGNAAYSYSWTANNVLLSSTSTFDVKSANFARGQYIIIQTLVNDGCSLADSVSFQVLIPTQPTVSIAGGDTSLCSGSTLMWQSHAQGGDSVNYGYDWRLNGQPISTQDSASSYFENGNASLPSKFMLSLSLMDGCAEQIARDSIEITVAPNPVVSFSKDSLNRNQFTDTLICRGEEVQFNPTTFYHAFASRPTLYQDGQLVSAGVYTLRNTESIGPDSVVFIAVSTQGCGAIDTAISIVYLRDPLRLAPIQDTVVCTNAKVSFEAKASGGLSANYLYSWIDKSDGSLLGTGQYFDVDNVDQRFQIELKVEDGCSFPNDSLSFEVKNLEPLDIVLTASAVCADTISFNANASGGRSTSYSYSWSIDQVPLANATNTLTIYPKQIANVLVILSDGCSGIAASDSLWVAERMRFQLDDAPDSICEPFETNWNMVTLSASPIDYRWSENGFLVWKPIDLNATFNAANYRFTFLAENALGCQDTLETDIVVKPIPSAQFSWSPERIDDDDPRAEFTAEQMGASYWWQVDAKLRAQNQNPFSYDFQEIGNYRVALLVDLKGCRDSSEQVVEVKEAFKSYDISAFSPNGDGTNDTYKPYVRGEVEELNYQIFNSWGQKIFEGTAESPAWDGSFRGDHVPDGHYLVVISIKTPDGKRIFKNNVIYLLR